MSTSVPGASGMRASRRKREPDRGLRFRSRDAEVLFALARMRLLSTSQLTRLFFGAKGTCQKRLRKLFDAELVRPLVTDLAVENRYAITRLGHALIERTLRDVAVGPYRPAPRVDRRGLVHLDLLNDTRIALALGVATEGLRLVSFRSDWDLRAEQKDAPIFPDAIIELAGPSRSWQLALEVDAGTESAGVFGRKLREYRRASEEGRSIFSVSKPTVLVVTHTERRARTLARQAQNVAIERTVFAFRESILADGGVTSGLALAADLVAEPTKLRIKAFSRGLLHPEGVAARKGGTTSLSTRASNGSVGNDATTSRLGSRRGSAGS